MRIVIIAIAVVVAVSVGAGLMLSVNRTATTSNSSTVIGQNQNTSTASGGSFTTNPSNANVAEELNTTVTPVFSLEKKSAHYVSNTPLHAAAVTTPPAVVTINFNFDLSTQSVISVTKDGNEYSTGQTVVADDKLVLERGLNPNAPDGVYTVNYSACWPDGLCHTGTFQFAIDRP